MNLQELRKGLGDDSLSDESLAALQPLYLVNASLSKDDFYKLVKAIGTGTAKAIAHDIQVLRIAANRAVDAEKKLVKLEAQLQESRGSKEMLQKTNDAIYEDYTTLRKMHEKLVRFMEYIPDAKQKFLEMRNKDAEDEFSEIMNFL